jgi:hypothetical protein
MKKSFVCPRCKGHLNVGSHIILAATSKSGDAGLILFNPEIGNYSTETNPEFVINLGEKVDFFCPICQKKLATDIHDNLSRIIMIDEDKKKFEILFSKIAGEKSTYKIIGESIEAFGDHHSNYIDFLNLSSLK